jgi:Spy/CpxP family protein refolding chaperone
LRPAIQARLSPTRPTKKEIMSTRLATILTIAVLVNVTPGAQHEQHHAAGTPGTPTALTAEQVKQLLNGEGMGLARPAELNGYPGPRHVLDLGSELILTPDQEKRVETIRQQMLTRAIALGKQIVQAETDLDAAFQSGTLSERDLGTRVTAIARLHGDLRLAHLRAHLQTKPVLSAEQVKKYYEKRPPR